MRYVRITELEVHQKCRWLWEYRYKYKARRPSDDDNFKAGMMVSGSAAHWGIEVGMLGQGDPRQAARDYLERELGEGGNRYRKGVETAIAGVPEDWWSKERPQVEDQYNVLYHRNPNGWAPYETGDKEDFDLDLEDPDLVLVGGKPDIWWIEDGDIMLTDFKTSSKVDDDKLATYELFNLQLDYYAVLITDSLTLQGKEVPPIYKRHALLSTQGRHRIGMPKLLDPVIPARRQQLLTIASEIGQLPLVPTPSTLCSFCDFRSIDEVRLTGGDWRAALEEWGADKQAPEEVEETLEEVE